MPLSPDTRHKLKEATRALRKGLERKPVRLRGRVSAVSKRDGAGRPLTVSVTPSDGSGVISGVSAAGRDAGEGAEVTIVGRGSGYSIEDVHGYAPGAPGRDVSKALSTPNFETISGMIPTQVYTTTTGDIKVRAFFPIWQIAEQYRHRQVIKYKVTVREAAGAKDEVMEFSTRAQGMVVRAVNGAITDTLDPIVYTSTPSFGGPNTTLPGRYGIVQIDDELVLYDTHDDANGELETLTRGYDGTTAAGHADGAYILARSVTVAAEGLAPNTTYEAQVVALCDADGRQSNPSNWLTFTTDYDVTAPTTPTNLSVDARPYKFALTWDENSETDFSYYEVRHSEDNSTWTTVNAGNGASFILLTEPGDVRFFQVRAVDTSGNASAWTSSVFAIAGDVGKQDQLQDPSFENDSPLSQWNTETGTGTTPGMVQSSTQAYSGIYSLNIDIISGSAGYVRSDSFSVDAGSEVYCDFRLHFSSFTIHPSISLTISINWLSGSTQIAQSYVESYGGGLPVTTGAWLHVAHQFRAPAGADGFELEFFLASGSTGGITAYVDDVRLQVPVVRFSDYFDTKEGMAVIEHYRNLPNLRFLATMGSIDENGDVRDASGQSRTLTNNNATDFGITGLVPYADFNGTDQYLSRADEAGLDITGELTLGGWFWFDTDSPASNEFLIAKRAAGLSYWIVRLSSNVSVQVGVWDGSNPFSVASTSVTQSGLFHFIVGRFTPSSEIAVFLDNEKTVETSSPVASINNTGAPFTIGARGDPTLYMDGRATLCFLCAAAVPDEQILTLYQKSRHLFGV